MPCPYQSNDEPDFSRLTPHNRVSHTRANVIGARLPEEGGRVSDNFRNIALTQVSVLVAAGTLESGL
jgi:hypothetical protein